MSLVAVCYNPGMDTGTTLRDLRKKSGLTTAQICTEAREVDKLFPATHNGLLSIEERGTENYWQIMALASVYKRDMAELARIAAPPKRHEN